MTAIKNKKRTSSAPRRKRPSNSGSATAIICVVLFAAVAAGIGGYFYFFGDKSSKNYSIDRNKKEDGSLIQDDEKIYRNFKNRRPGQDRKSTSQPERKKESAADDKPKFEAPKYGEKDKNYLDKLIRTR